MTDLATFDQEHPVERLTRRQRAERRNAGPHGADGLTDGERQLLDTIRAQGWDIQRHWMLNERTGQHYQHQRAVVKAKPSWSHSIR